MCVPAQRASEKKLRFSSRLTGRDGLRCEEPQHSSIVRKDDNDTDDDTGRGLYSYYVLAETHGSNAEHDYFLEDVMAQDYVVNSVFWRKTCPSSSPFARFEKRPMRPWPRRATRTSTTFPWPYPSFAECMKQQHKEPPSSSEEELVAAYVWVSRIVTLNIFHRSIYISIALDTIATALIDSIDSIDIPLFRLLYCS